jgi:hypothetical protein
MLQQHPGILQLVRSDHNTVRQWGVVSIVPSFLKTISMEFCSE